MSRSNLKQDVLQNASAGIARSIVEVDEIRAEIKLREPLLASRLDKQINSLKTALKDVEKLRLLGAESPVKFDVVNSSKTQHGLPTEISTIARQIQYEVAKIEVLEMIIEITLNRESKAAYTMISTLRKSLYEACEVFLEPGREVASVSILTNVASSVSCFLEQVANNCNLDEPDTLFLQKLVASIVSRLEFLRAELGNYQKQSSYSSVNLSGRLELGLWIK
ncbi:MAG TPA: hypothetical protein VL134_13535 [Leptolyngbya sp.]|jgi:hypothetical protein|nr:hypothetical protein [Leptolyngbya sp.]